MDKERKKLIDNVSYLIEALDAYRVGRNADPKVFEGKYEEIADDIRGVIDRGRKKVLMSSIDYMINLPLKDRSARTWSSVFLISRLLIRITFTLLLLSVLLYVISLGQIANYLLIAGVILFYVVSVLRWHSLNKLLDFYGKQTGRADSRRILLKEAAQDLINYLRQIKGERKVKLHLYNRDYDGIKVLRRPGWLRDYYLVEVV
ncbi:MAG: hypothetical protein ACUX7D_07800 [Candidatus Methanodesulfokora washburnensis]|jgi:hypothetical protein